VSEQLAELIEQLALRWTESSDIGRNLRNTMTQEEALDAVFQLLNAGFLKIAVSRQRQPIGFTFSPIPRQPAQTILRPTKRMH
jgi:hypothetical protein